ncbi:hypothetical protein ABE288_10060 [Bacillus salipaludis]
MIGNETCLQRGFNQLIEEHDVFLLEISIQNVDKIAICVDIQ